MKRFVISEDEKARILSMHESAIKRQYLSEQPAPQQGAKVADPNAKMYDTPNWDFLLTTNVPEFFTKNDINFSKFVKHIKKEDINGEPVIVLPYNNQKLRLYIKKGGDKYLDSYDGYTAKFKDASKKFVELYNTTNPPENFKKDVYQGKSIKDSLYKLGCIATGNSINHFKPMTSLKPGIVVNKQNCERQLKKLDDYVKTIKLKELSDLSDMEKFINQARKLSA